MIKKLTLSCLLLSLGTISAVAQRMVRAQTQIQKVTLYQRGAFVEIKATANLTGGATETVVLPDFWYIDANTLQIKPTAATQAVGIRFVQEARPAPSAAAVELQQINVAYRDSILRLREELIQDSIVLLRKEEFLRANMDQKATSVTQLQATEKYMEGQFQSLYAAKAKLSEKRQQYDQSLQKINGFIAEIEQKYGRVIQASLDVEKLLGPQKVEFEISYYTEAAQWSPVYFFRFDPTKTTAELEFSAAVKQWTSYNWKGVPTELSYNRPWVRLPRPTSLHPIQARYHPPVKGIPVDIGRFGGTYNAEEMAIADAPMAQARQITAVPVVSEAELRASQAGISYLLPRPLNLNYSGSEGQLTQHALVNRRQVPVFFTYTVTPRYNTDVTLTANLPKWRELYLTNGQVNVFCDGQMLAQTSLGNLSQTSDTLAMPLMVEQGVAVDRKQVEEYKERASGSKTERSYAYRITLRNNREFPIEVTVKDQYPVSTTAELEVLLTESSGAVVNAAEGLLTWVVKLAPGEERQLNFGYTVRYPKEGSISL